MKQGKNKWEQFVELPETYSRADIAEQVIKEVEDEKKRIYPRNKIFYCWKPIVACIATFLIGIGITIPIYNVLQPPEIVYYESGEIAIESVSDIVSFIDERKLSVCYFNLPKTTTQCATICSTNEVAFLIQDLSCITDMGTDNINVKSIIIDNAQFEFYSKFASLDEAIIVGEVEVFYTSIIKIGMIKQQVLAQFTYQGIEYYMDILTANKAEECVRTYVSMLIG